ncbi:hypothetical protein BDW62DRAFT_186024 [Aspergillus aurantiobrunneus]
MLLQHPILRAGGGGLAASLFSSHLTDFFIPPHQSSRPVRSTCSLCNGFSDYPDIDIAP